MAEFRDQRRPSWPPQPAFFTVRLCKNGWTAPARIRCENGLWQTVIDGNESEWDADPVKVRAAWIWTSGRFCDEKYYNYLNALREHYRKYPQLYHPCADATKPARKDQMRPIFL